MKAWQPENDYVLENDYVTNPYFLYYLLYLEQCIHNPSAWNHVISSFCYLVLRTLLCSFNKEVSYVMRSLHSNSFFSFQNLRPNSSVVLIYCLYRRAFKTSCTCTCTFDICLSIGWRLCERLRDKSSYCSATVNYIFSIYKVKLHHCSTGFHWDLMGGFRCQPNRHIIQVHS